MTNTINVNKRPDFISKQFADLNAQRIISIALPFLSLHSKTARISSLAIGAYQFYSANTWSERALLVSSTALGHFCPLGQLALSSSAVLYKCYQDPELKSLLQITSQAIHIASIYYGTPAWIVASLLSQATGELVEAYKHSQHPEGRTPELIATVLLAAIRTQKAYTIQKEQFRLRQEAQERELQEQVQKEAKELCEKFVKERELQEQSQKEQFRLSQEAKDKEFQEQVQKEANEFCEKFVKERELQEQSQKVIQELQDGLPRDFSKDTLFQKDIHSDSKLWAVVAETEIPVMDQNKKLSTEDWKTLYEQFSNTGEKIHLSTLLKARGFTTSIEDVDFSVTGVLEQFIFEKMEFKNCNFSNMTIRNVDIKFCNFTECNLSNISASGDLVYVFLVNFNSCNLSSISGNIFFSSCTYDNCLGQQKDAMKEPSTHIDMDDLRMEEEATDRFENIERTFKNPYCPFTEENHELSGDLSAKMAARRFMIKDANDQEYDFGSYFNGFGGNLVKGHNLHFRTTEAGNGSKFIELSFRVNHIYHTRLRQLVKTLYKMDPQDRNAFANEIQSRAFYGNRAAYFTQGHLNYDDESAKEIVFEGIGSLMVGDKNHINFRDQVKVTLNEGASIESFHHFLSIFGLQDAIKQTNEDDIRRLKLGTLFRTFYPAKARFMEKKDAFFTLPPDELKQAIIQEAPAMDKIFAKHTVVKRELFPGYVKYGVPLGNDVSGWGGRALTTALTSLHNNGDDRLEKKQLDQIANIVKNGLLSQELRDKNGISITGLNDEEQYEDGGAQSVYTQIITARDIEEQKKMKNFGYFSPVRLYISLDALHQGSYQYLNDNFGVKAGFDYKTRLTLKEFMQRNPDQFNGHEIMLPDRVLPQYIKAMSVKTQEIKDQIIAHLRQLGLVHQNLQGQAIINGIPVDEFIHHNKRLTPEMVKSCYTV